ncbi:MAG: type II toxin-antitoxin system VapB family antitoxin, partial [Micropruina sp.]|nr:type II toxin-antitoxin system VapB family antitoxin [Micropruina sp.]
MTKTLIDLDDQLMRRALELSGLTTKQAVVTSALESMVRRLEVQFRSPHAQDVGDEPAHQAAADALELLRAAGGEKPPGGLPGGMVEQAEFV